MYAIVEIAGKQYKVRENDKLFVPHLADAKVDDTIEFDRVLLFENDGDVKVGTPLVADATMSAKVLEHVKADKVLVFRKIRRKRFRVKRGHRQRYTQIEVSGLSINGGEKKSASAKKATAAETKAKAKDADPAESKAKAKDADGAESKAKAAEAKKAEATQSKAKAAEAKEAEGAQSKAKDTEAKDAKAAESKAKDAEAKKAKQTAAAEAKADDDKTAAVEEAKAANAEADESGEAESSDDEKAS